MRRRTQITIGLMLATLLVIPIAVSAQDGLDLVVETEQACGQVNFTLTIIGGTAPYDVELKFGDTEVFEVLGTTETSFNPVHAYPAHGEYTYTAKVKDSDEGEVEFDGEIVIDGPEVTLSSDPFPPLLTIEGGTASILFEAKVTGGEGDYAYSWDLDEDGLADAGLEVATASHSYTANGKYSASVTVIDECGLADTDSLTVIVDDPEEAAEESCHPMAQRIAEAVSALVPDGLAETSYTCEDIFNWFEGGLTGTGHSFGRMWKAYQLTQAIGELTWEEVLDWKLQYSSWGALTQLNRTAEFLEEYGIRDLIDLIASEEYTLRDVRSAARSVLRYEADFLDALDRIAGGASPGELGQFYKLATELELDPADLDTYLAEGTSLAEIRHAAKLSERTGSEWNEILEFKSAGDSWGEIGQAYKMANEDVSAAEILAIGVKEFRETQREEDRAQRETDRNDRTANRLAEQFNADPGVVQELFENSECAGDWGCVRKKLREGNQTEVSNDRDLRTANQIASKYGVSADVVMEQFEACNRDWNCVRAHFRNNNSPGKGKNK